jgi:uncharacterized membrane protein YjgN (DUF898 family)
MFAALEAGDIVEVIWVSLLAGIVVTISYSLVIFGGARWAEARRAGTSAAAIAWAGLAVLAFAAFAGTVVFGVHIMLAKS